jgi:hypothetical protein
LRRPRRPRLLLLLECVDLVLVALRLHLVPVVVDAQVLDLQLQHLDLVLEPPVLHLLLHVPVIGTPQLTKELIGVLLQFLQPDRVSGALHLAAGAELARRRVAMH